VLGCKLLTATSSGMLNCEPQQQVGGTIDCPVALRAQRLSCRQAGGSAPCGDITRAAAVAAAQRHVVASAMHGAALSSITAGARSLAHWLGAPYDVAVVEDDHASCIAGSRVVVARSCPSVMQTCRCHAHWRSRGTRSSSSGVPACNGYHACHLQWQPPTVELVVGSGCWTW
jgi:hypothetical protein